MILKSERLNLRPVSIGDAGHIHVLHTHEDVTRFNTLELPRDIGVTETLITEWIEGGNQPQGGRYIFAIELNDGTFVGLIGITLGREKYRNAEVWFKYLPEYWNKGYGTEALKRVLTFGFSELNLHRIEAGCAVANVGSIRVMEKAGMQREAHTRQLLPLVSGWSDNYGYAILSTD